jgi:hypothetical protein
MFKPFESIVIGLVEEFVNRFCIQGRSIIIFR